MIKGSLSIYDFFTLKQLKAQGFAKKREGMMFELIYNSLYIRSQIVQRC